MLPKELRSCRLALGVSLEEFARRIGVETSLLAALENGEVLIPASVVAAVAAMGAMDETSTRPNGPT